MIIKRTYSNAIALIILFLIIIPLNVFFLFGNKASKLTRNERINAPSINVPIKPTTGEVQVELKQAFSGIGGNVDLVLSLNIEQLLRSIDVTEMNGGEATDNPVPYHPGFRIPNKDICKSSKGLKYIIYIHSAPANKDQRDNIRTTWGNKALFKDRRTNIVFIMGLPSVFGENSTQLQEAIVKESFIHQDIVQAEYMDTYKNLTLKGIASLKWISKYCPQAQYAIKADDDAFVNIFELIKIMESNENHKKVVICPFWGENAMPILRDPENCMKWCVKYTEFPGQTYFPDYCAGLSYTMSRDVIPEMHNKSHSTPSFWIDDVYITGLLLGKVKQVKYESLLSNLTLSEDTALEEYSNITLPINYYFVHVQIPSNLPKLFEYALHKLSPQQLDELSDNVLKQYTSTLKS